LASKPNAAEAVDETGLVFSHAECDIVRPDPTEEEPDDEEDETDGAEVELG
jgi:hypothetical protein